MCVIENKQTAEFKPGVLLQAHTHTCYLNYFNRMGCRRRGIAEGAEGAEGRNHRNGSTRIVVCGDTVCRRCPMGARVARGDRGDRGGRGATAAWRPLGANVTDWSTCLTNMEHTPWDCASLQKLSSVCVFAPSSVIFTGTARDSWLIKNWRRSGVSLVPMSRSRAATVARTI